MIVTTLVSTAVLFAPQVSKHTDTDTVRLNDGKQFKGRVLYEDEEIVQIRVRRKNREFSVKDVKEVRSLERSLQEWADRYDAIAPDDADDLADLARFCTERGLADEALVTWAKALFVDPTREDAYEAFDGRKARKGWQIKIGRRWKTLDEIKQIHGKWKDRWELETTHFILRTDMPAEQLLDLAMDVERYYLAFYEVMRPSLKLLVFNEVPIINVYVESNKMPKPPVDVDAWFSWVRNELDVRVRDEDEIDMQLIMREMTRLMLNNSLRRTIGNTGNVSPWAGEGISDYFAGAVSGDPGHLRLEFGSDVQRFFTTHAKASRPLSLRRILAAGRMDFHTGTNAELAKAQAYTLVHFLVKADDGKYRDGFLDFLRSSFAGQGSETHFRRALGLDDLRDLEAAWNDYAKSKG